MFFVQVALWQYIRDNFLPVRKATSSKSASPITIRSRRQIDEPGPPPPTTDNLTGPSFRRFPANTNCREIQQEFCVWRFRFSIAYCLTTPLIYFIINNIALSFCIFIIILLCFVQILYGLCEWTWMNEIFVVVFVSKFDYDVTMDDIQLHRN